MTSNEPYRPTLCPLTKSLPLGNNQEGVLMRDGGYASLFADDPLVFTNSLCSHLHLCAHSVFVL